MELKTALENIAVYNKVFAEEEILYIRRNRDAAIPALLDIVRTAAANIDIDDEDDEAYCIYALHLLAEFGVHDAFEPIIALLELDEEECEWLLGDLITESMSSIIGSVANRDDVERIMSVAENTGLDGMQRLAAVGALVVMYMAGKLDRADVSAGFGRLLSKPDDDATFWGFLADNCEDVKLTEHYQRITELNEAGKLDSTIMPYELFKNPVTNMTEEEIKAELAKKPWHCAVTDTVKSLSGWACFTHVKLEKKIGRNAPCPCGSGRKYKHCCLNKDA